jgi:AcrR family transcriptional regulator
MRATIRERACRLPSESVRFRLATMRRPRDHPPAVAPRAPKKRASAKEASKPEDKKPEDKKAARRAAILDAATAVFGDKGYAAATVDDIVLRLGVARGTFYLYFDDKQDVFDALVDDFVTRLEAAVISIDVAHPTITPVEQLRQNLARVISLALSEPVLMRLALHDAASQGPELARRVDAFYERLHRLLDESLSIGQRIGLVRAGDRRVMVAIGLGGLKEMIYAAARGALKGDADALVEEMMLFLRGGLLAPPPITRRR